MPKTPQKLPKGKVRFDVYLRRENKLYIKRLAKQLQVSDSRAIDYVIDQAKEKRVRYVL